jgi:transforming growth factor-beta-induced protein
MNMKLRYTAFLLLSLIIISCERENLTNEKVKILEGIKKDSELSKLSQAIDRVNLKSALIGTQYTFFAPTDEAFTNAGIDPNSIEPSVLLNILQYHMIPSRIDSSRFGVEYGLFFGQIFGPSYLGQLTYQGFQTLNLNLNANLYCTNATQEVPALTGNVLSRGLFFNGAQVVGFDSFEGADGVVHKINKVLLPPVGSLSQVVATDPDLSIFNKLINKAASTTGIPSYAATTLSALPADALATSRTGTLTVLAPTNEAMIAATITEAFIEASTPATCLDIARRHVIALRNFSSDFYNQSIRPTPVITYNTQQAGKAITYNSDSKGVFFTNALTTRADVVKANVVATNGVLHKINSAIN